VVATDPSATGIAQVALHPRANCRVEPAERSSLVAGNLKEEVIKTLGVT
jgi:hypothetical protein